MKNRLKRMFVLSPVLVSEATRTTTAVTYPLFLLLVRAMALQGQRQSSTLFYMPVTTMCTQDNLKDGGSHLQLYVCHYYTMCTQCNWKSAAVSCFIGLSALCAPKATGSQLLSFWSLLVLLPLTV